MENEAYKKVEITIDPMSEISNENSDSDEGFRRESLVKIKSKFHRFRPHRVFISVLNKEILML